MIPQLWQRFVKSSWARKHAIAAGAFFAGMLAMSLFWQEIKTVAEMRGYSMDDVRTGLKVVAGTLASIGLGAGYGGTLERDRQRRKEQS